MAKKNKQNTVNPLAPAPTNHEALDANPFRNLKLAGSEKKNKKVEKEEIKPTFKSFGQEDRKIGGSKKGFGYVGGKKSGVAHHLGKESQAIATDESEAFANAMGGVEAWTTDALGNKGPKSNKKAPKGTLKNSLGAKKALENEPVIAMNELEEFKALEDTLKKKNKNNVYSKSLSHITESLDIKKKAEQDASANLRPSVYVPSLKAEEANQNNKVQAKHKYSAEQRSRLAVQNQREQEAALFDEDGPEDEMVFANALESMKDVKPLNVRGRQLHPEVEPLPAAQTVHDPVQDFLDGLIEFKLEFTAEYLEGHVVGLDPITIEKLRAGQYSPEAHLDLHGMNAEQAYEDLIRFFRRAYHQGLRTVLIIPGRGRNSPNGYGVLRERLQRWLTQDPFKRVVLAFCTAQLNDGGAGAVYVLLRKYKKSRGKIHWDRLPTDSDLY